MSISVYIIDATTMVFHNSLTVKSIDAGSDVFYDATLGSGSSGADGKTKWSGDSPWGGSVDGWSGNKWSN